MHEKLWEQTRPFWEKWQTSQIAIAFSGGLDSIVLLHLADRAKKEYGLDIEAIHIHHGLQDVADEWVNFCRCLTQEWDISFTVHYVCVNKKQQGLEGAAREARYQALQKSRADVILTAHHRDDQIETVLLALLRGGGVRALAAMPEQSMLGSKILARPLLNTTREQLKTYAEFHQLTWIDDPSNTDTHLLRNWVRHEWLPNLLQRLPNAKAQLLSCIGSAQEELCLINEIAEMDWQNIQSDGQWDCFKWQKLSPARRRLLLHQFAVRHQKGAPSSAALKAWEQQLYQNPALTAQWSLPKGKIYADRGTLWSEPEPFVWEVQDIEFKEYYNSIQDFPESWKQGYIRTVRDDDCIQLNVGKKKIRRVLQQHHIPVFMRNRWPVLEVEGKIVAVFNLRLSDEYANLSLPKIPLLIQYIK